MKDNIEVKDVQKTEYLDKNGLDMLWAKVKENTRNQVEAESNRAVTQETRIIETKADKTELNNYVSDTALKALEKKVSANTAAISGKQNAGNYIPFEKRGLNDNRCYIIAPSYYIECRTDKFDNGKYNYSHIDSQYISVNSATGRNTTIGMEGININEGGNASNEYNLQLSPSSISSHSNGSGHFLQFRLSRDGLELEGGRGNEVLTSNGSTIDINQYVLKSVYDEKIAALEARIAALEAKHTETD